MGEMSTSHYQPDRDIPDLSGRVYLVTGGNSGLGYETIRQLARHNPQKIWMGARNKAKAEAAIEAIQRANKIQCAPIEFLELDLASFESIKAAARRLNLETNRLDVLINNAGIMACPEGQTKEGYELQFGTNHLGHALLTQLLMPKLKQTARSGSDVRIVVLSSRGERYAPPEGYLFEPADRIKSGMPEISTWARYGQSKLANIHYVRSLARQHPDIICVSIHPGRVNTGLVRGMAESWPWLSWLSPIIMPLTTVPVTEGAKNQLWAATAPKQHIRSGEFYWPLGVTGMGTAKVNDETMERRLRDWTEKELRGHVEL
ncbi:hypothetical protein RBB50_008899 [Rhinocladiella similis]